MLGLFTTQATCIADRFGAALIPTAGKRSHAEVIQEEKKGSVTYRTSTGAHRARGTCWASLSLQGTNKDGHGVFVLFP